MKKLLLLALLGIATTYNIACMGCTHVEPGEVGVEVESCSGGGITPTPLAIGWHTTGPCTAIHNFPTSQQNIVLSKNVSEGNPEDDSINVNDKDGLNFNIDASLAYTVQPDKAPAIYGKYKTTNLASIGETYFRQIIRQALQNEFGKYTAEEIYSNKKEIVRSSAEKVIAAKMLLDGFVVTQFTVNEARPPQQVIDAIKNKVAMTQMSQQAEQAVKKAEAEGKQRIAAAQADADAVRLHADAEAYANQKIAASLTPQVVQNNLMKKWNGVLPVYNGSGANMMFNMGSGK